MFWLTFELLQRQHKLTYIKTVNKSYPVMVAPIENLNVGIKTKKSERKRKRKKEKKYRRIWRIIYQTTLRL